MDSWKIGFVINFLLNLADEYFPKNIKTKVLLEDLISEAEDLTPDNCPKRIKVRAVPMVVGALAELDGENAEPKEEEKPAEEEPAEKEPAGEKESQKAPVSQDENKADAYEDWVRKNMYVVSCYAPGDRAVGQRPSKEQNKSVRTLFLECARKGYAFDASPDYIIRKLDTWRIGFVITLLRKLDSWYQYSEGNRRVALKEFVVGISKLKPEDCPKDMRCGTIDG